MMATLNLAESLKRYFWCLFQGHMLLKYTVFCLLDSYGTRKVNALDTKSFFGFNFMFTFGKYLLYSERKI